jgi:hypothetical protein
METMDAHAGPVAENGNLMKGASMAAFMAAGIGAFAVGLSVLLDEMGILAGPSLNGPSGGVTGRVMLAVTVWLISWAVLHVSWKDREVDAGRVATLILVLTVLGVLGTVPPFWTLVS